LDGQLLYFNDIHYDYSSKAFLYREAIQMMIRTKKTDLKEVLNYIENSAQVITLYEIMQHSHIICLLNGIYNIKTREFSTIFSPDYYVFDQIPWNYDYDHTIPFETIKKFVSDMIPDEVDRWFYYDFGSICFHPYNGIYFQLGLVGKAGTGKTQLTILNGNLFDEDKVLDPTIQSISDDATTRKDTALNRMIIDGDMHDTGIKTISNLKRWISQESFTDRSIYEHVGKKYRPSSRVMFSANSLYEIPNKDDAEAIYDRTKLIQFEKKIRYTKNEVKDFIKKLIPKEEYDGYVTFLLSNASDIWDRQDTKYTLDPSEARSIWNKFGNYMQSFFKKYVVRESSNSVKGMDLRDAWDNFTIQNNIDKVLSSTEFYKLFEDTSGIEKSKVWLREQDTAVWGFYGIRLKTEKEIEIEEQTQLFSYW